MHFYINARWYPLLMHTTRPRTVFKKTSFEVRFKGRFLLKKTSSGFKTF